MKKQTFADKLFNNKVLEWFFGKDVSFIRGASGFVYATVAYSLLFLIIYYLKTVKFEIFEILVLFAICLFTLHFWDTKISNQNGIYLVCLISTGIIQIGSILYMENTYGIYTFKIFIAGCLLHMFYAIGNYFYRRNLNLKARVGK